MPQGADRAAPGDAVALIDREGEQATLRSLVLGAARGRGGVAVVTGPPGAGKTALLDAVRAYASTQGLTGLHARGRELERGVGFGVAAALLGPAVRAAGPAERRSLMSGLAGLSAALLGVPEPDEPAARGAPSPAAEQRVLGLYWLVAALCRPQDDDGPAVPLLLTVDDAHWSDTGSLRFLCHLADRAGELPVALVVAARPGAPDERRRWLDRLAGRPGGAVVTLRPLGADAVATLVRHFLPGATAATVDACATMSGGNPFLLTELLRSLRADGPFRPGGPPGAGEPFGAGPADHRIAEVVPDTVLRAVLDRLGRLDDTARLLAGAVAVLGDDAPPARAADLAGIDIAAAEDAADALAAAHLLRPGAPLSFTHPLIASAVHAEMPRFARSRAHRRAADVLTTAGEPADVVAGHLLRTEPRAEPRTVEMLAAGAARARRRGDAAAEARFLERAVAEPPSPARRAGLLTDLAEARLRAGDPAAADTCRAAVDAAAGAAERARAHDVLAQILTARGEIDEAAAHSARALGLLEPGGREWQDLLARHLTATAFHPRRRAETRAWLAPIAAAAAAGRPTGHPGLRTHLVLHLALNGAATARRIAELAVGLDGAPPVVAENNGALAGLLTHALVLVDELDAAEKIADEALRAAREQGSVVAYANAGYHRALCRYPRGALAEAWADLEQVRTVPATGGPGAAGWIGALMTHLALDLGDTASARAGLRLARRAPEGSMEHAVALVARARAHLRDAEADAAAEAARRAGHLLSTGFGVDHPGLVPWRPLAALAAYAAGRPDDARSLAAEAVERAEALGLARALGVALHAAGLVAPARSSVPLLTRAVAVLDGSPGVLEHVRALVSLGVALRRANRRGPARTALRTALDRADAMGCGPLAARARAELVASGARPRRAAVSGRAALTPTERRVADLAATGHTNRQIAQALFVTAKTVETHLTRVYRKLQVSDRGRLAGALGGPAAPAGGSYEPWPSGRPPR